MEGWHEGDSALQVALGNTASSFGRERIPIEDAAAVLRALAAEQVHVLGLVARSKLEGYPVRGYDEQVAEMYAAAALLLAASVPASAEQPPHRGGASRGLTA